MPHLCPRNRGLPGWGGVQAGRHASGSVLGVQVLAAKRALVCRVVQESDGKHRRCGLMLELMPWQVTCGWDCVPWGQCGPAASAWRLRGLLGESHCPLTTEGTHPRMRNTYPVVPWCSGARPPASLPTVDLGALAGKPWLGTPGREHVLGCVRFFWAELELAVA